MGSRTTRDRDARGTGIEVFDMSSAEWRHVGSLPCSNPSFLAPGQHVGDWYVVHGDGHEVSRIHVDPDGIPSMMETVDCGGTNPVHLCVAGDQLLVVNHSGSITRIPLDKDGALGEVASRIDFVGRPGPHATDQGRSKPHQVVPLDGSRFLVPDKGLDTVHLVRLDRATGRLSVAGDVRLRELSGPRHITIHPRLEVAYTVDELSSTVTVIGIEGDQLDALEVRSALDPFFTGDSRGGEILISADGAHVVSSNRSGAGDRTPGGPHDDTIAVFPVAPDGHLGCPSWRSTGGIRPRFMCWLPEEHGEDSSATHQQLLVANERSDSLVQVSLQGPRSRPVVVARTGSPVCVVFQ